MPNSKRILFFAEAVTLAHVARPLVLAAAASEMGHETTIACDQRYDRFVKGGAWTALPLHSISAGRFLNALAQGKPFYDEDTLCAYVEEDMTLIKRVKPDLVVGDFRLSLSVSARLLGVPYVAVTNAYWSPYATARTLPLPVLPITKALPLPVAEVLFKAFAPFVSRQFCRPLNRVREKYGLPALKTDLRVTYTDADHVLYADLPGMFATEPLPSNHLYIGPILWAPPMAIPAWWNSITAGKPIIYLTLGSSGPPELLAVVLDAIAGLPVTVMASTAGAAVPSRSSGSIDNDVHISDYLPGIEAAARSDLVICNGGSPTTQQALTAGVPVLGLASNMDQFLNMAAVVEANAGTILRADRASRSAIRRAIEHLLSSKRFKDAAVVLSQNFTTLDSRVQFCSFVERVTGNHPLPASMQAAPE